MRIPAQATVASAYTYSDHFACTEKEMQADENKFVKWSPLSGFRVSHNSFERWQKSNQKILRPFSSDGCSVSPDGIPGSTPEQKWTDCCVNHDISYWLGGTLAEKELADQELQQCIADKG